MHTGLDDIRLTMPAEEDKGNEGTGVQMALAPGSSNPAQTSCVELASTCPTSSWNREKSHSCGKTSYLVPVKVWSTYFLLLWNFPFTSQTHLLIIPLHPHPAPHLQLFQYISSPDSPSHCQFVLGSIPDFPACFVRLISWFC